MKDNRLTPHWRKYKQAGFSIVPITPMELNGRNEWVCTCNSAHCQAAGKHPTIRRWENVVHTHSDEATHRLVNSKCQAFGVSADGWLIVDVDPRNGGGIGLEKLEEALDCYLEDIAGLTVETGGGGLHYYFKAPDDVKLVTGKKEFPGVDFVHGLHYVVGAGSAHKSGGSYTIKKGSPDAIDFPPQALVDLIERQAWIPGTGGDGEAEPELVEMAIDAIPNDDLDYDEWLRIGMALAHWDDSAGYALFVKWSEKSSKFNPSDLDRRWASFGDTGAVNVGTIFQRAMLNGWERPQPPAYGEIDEDGKIIPGVVTLAQREMMRKALTTPKGMGVKAVEVDLVEDAAPTAEATPQPETQTQNPNTKTGGRNFWQKSTDADAVRHSGAPVAGGAVTDTPEPVKARPELPVPPERAVGLEYIVKLPGWAGVIYDHIARTAWGVVPGAIAAASLQALSVCGWGVRAANGGSTNLITMVIAPSGGGKQHPQDCFKEMIQSVGRQPWGSIRSDKDLVYGLVDGNGKSCYLVDEAHGMFGGMGNSKFPDKIQQQLGAKILEVATAKSLVLSRNWYDDITARDGATIKRIEKELDKANDMKGKYSAMNHEELEREIAGMAARIKMRQEYLHQLKTEGIKDIGFNLLCSSTPEMFGSQIDLTAIQSGLAGRSLIFDCGTTTSRTSRHAPPDDAARRREINAFLETLRMAGEAELRVAVSSQADKIFDQVWEKYQNDDAVRDEANMGPLNRRMFERVASVSSILALGMPMHNGEFLITEEVARCAWDLAEMHLRTCKFLLGQSTAEESNLDGKTGFQARILHIMQKTDKDSPLPYAALRQRFLASVKWKNLNKRLTQETVKANNDLDYLGTEISNMLKMGQLGGAQNKPCWITPKGKKVGGYDKTL